MDEGVKTQGSGIAGLAQAARPFCDALLRRSTPPHSGSPRSGSRRGLIAGLLATLLLDGCASLQDTANREGAELGAGERVALLRQLKESAERIHASLDRMVAVQQSALSATPAHPPQPSSGAFTRRLDFNWAGPIEPALKALARAAGLPEPEIKGRNPVVPVMLNLDATNRSVGEILEEIGWQAGDRAWVHLDAERGRVELGYPDTTASTAATARDEPLPEKARSEHGRPINPTKGRRR